jgi:RNA polymerase-binding transcription factor DksA
MDPDAARQRLEAEKSRVSGLINELHTELDDEVETDETETKYDPADRGTDTFEREKDLSILESLETELAEIEAAIERIDQGTYGIDELTGAPIDPARLEAVPIARTNVDAPAGQAD